MIEIFDALVVVLLFMDWRATCHPSFALVPSLRCALVNGCPNPPLHGDVLFSGMKNASRQIAQEPGQGQAAVFCSLA